MSFNTGAMTLVNRTSISKAKNGSSRATRNLAKTKQHLETDLWLFENYSISSSTLSSEEAQKSASFNEVL